MAFKNRNVEHHNRKKINIVKIEKINDEIISMVVDVKREEGDIFDNGTELTAENLTNEINNLIQSKLSSGLTNNPTTYDKSKKIATTQFVWNVLEALNLLPSSGGGGNGGSS